VYDETCKTVGKCLKLMQLTALKMPRKILPDMAWPGGQNFSGWYKIFNAITEIFYPRIKIF